MLFWSSPVCWGGDLAVERHPGTFLFLLMYVYTWGSSEELVSPQLQLELDLYLSLDDRVGEDKGLCGHV